MSDVKYVTPKELAIALSIDAKSLRGWLRGSEFARSAEQKNTSWSIGPEAVAAATEHFAKQRTK